MNEEAIKKEEENSQKTETQITAQTDLTRENVITQLQGMINNISLAKRQELEHLKQAFYKLHKAEQEKQLKEFVESGGKVEDFTPTPDPLEEQYKKLMDIIKKKKAAAQEALEIVQQENLKKKYEILNKLKDLVENANTEGASYQDFKAILEEWKEIKEIPADKVSELWKNFQQYAEKFYDIQRLNNEFREYDFKKNMEAKIAICEEAEKLAESPDIVSAFRKLQNLHAEYRETGPVSKDSREEIWNRFKTSSTIINKKYQEHFEELKKNEQEHLDRKIAICEILEGIDYDSLNKYKDWNDKTQEVLSIQKKWKEIGFAPLKQNQKIFERYRAACDVFFKKKGEFFKDVKNNLDGNLEKKTALCEQAEALKDSTDWKETSARIAELQREWKSIGPIKKKFNTTLWNRFIEACNYFYNQRDKNFSSKKKEESVNLAQKRSIIESLKTFQPGQLSDNDRQRIKDLVGQWNHTGFVPFKFKEKLANEFKSLMEQFPEVRMQDRSSRKQGTTRSGNMGNISKDRLVQKYEEMKNEIAIYENNLGNLNAFSKSGNSIVDSIQARIDQLKVQAQEVLDQIKALNKPKDQPTTEETVNGISASENVEETSSTE